MAKNHSEKKELGVGNKLSSPGEDNQARKAPLLFSGRSCVVQRGGRLCQCLLCSMQRGVELFSPDPPQGANGSKDFHLHSLVRQGKIVLFQWWLRHNSFTWKLDGFRLLVAENESTPALQKRWKFVSTFMCQVQQCLVLEEQENTFRFFTWMCKISGCFQNMAMLLYLDSCSLVCGVRTTQTSVEAFMMDYRVLE